MTFQLLTRDQFRERVFARDQYVCVNCQAPAVDAHHIIQRRLFSAPHELGGYFLANGVSLCGPCHLQAEETILSCQTLRQKLNLTSYPLPEHLYPDQEYDTWGNPILSNGLRLPGELFHEPSVQKILEPLLSLFTYHIHYPRTFHFPWTKHKTSDDKILSDLSGFIDKEIVISVKMDGESCSMYHDYIHARSTESNYHPSRTWIRALHGQIKHEIPKGWRFCFENMYAQHSIIYNNLESYAYLISIWDEKNYCLSWDETAEWAQLLDLKTVPIIYRGPWNEKYLRELNPQEYQGDICEGYVVRIADKFHYKDFKRVVGKMVRANHITSSEHWAYQEVKPNKLKSPL